jgi:hypothetical protein
MSESSLPTPGPEHRRLEIFVGEWRTEGEILASEDSPAVPFTALDTYEWFPGGFFLVHHVDARMGDTEVKALEVIGYNAAGETYTTRSYDNHGGSSAYQGILSDRSWTIFGDSERFHGEFSADGRTLTGRWEQCREGSTWTPWMDIRLIKVG